MKWRVILTILLVSLLAPALPASAGGMPTALIKNCQVNGEASPRDLDVSGDGLNYGQFDNVVLLSRLKTRGGTCHLKFDRAVNMIIDSSQGAITLDGRPVPGNKTLQTGAHLVVVYNAGNGSNGYLVTMEVPEGAVSPAVVAQAAPAQVAATVPSQEEAPNGSCDLSWSANERRFMDPADAGTALWQPWHQELKNRGGGCHVYSGPTGGVIKKADGDVNLAPRTHWFWDYTPGNQSAGFKFLINAGYTFPQAQAQPAANTLKERGIFMSPTPERGYMHGSCTLRQSGFNAMPYGNADTRLYQNPFAAALEAEGAECHVYSGTTGGWLRITGGDVEVPANHDVWVIVAPGPGRSFAFDHN